MKKQIKRITAFAAAVAMAAAFTFPAEIGDSFFGFGNVIVASAERLGDWVYTVNDDQTVTITGYYGFEDAVEIPKFIDGNAVTSIGDRAFRNCPGLKSITIPYGVTSIGEDAFRNCSGLTSITIPYGVTSIGDYAFESCTGLESITIPDRVTSIGEDAFRNCSGLTSITIPDRVTSIGDGAFMDCHSLTSINIPDGVTSIGYAAFNYCTGLTIIYIPDGISIGQHAIPSTAARITYIVNSDGSVTITKIELTNGQNTIDIPAAINGKTVIAVEEGYRSCVGNHTCASSTPATCINEAACGICGQDYYGDHNISHHDAAAHTCTADGTIEYWDCSVCGKYFSDPNGTTEITNIVDPNDPARHSLVKTDAKAPTCTDDGNRAYWTCAECGNIFSDESGINQTTLDDVTIYATGHTLTHHDAVAPDCTTDGNVEYWDCSVCGNKFSDDNGTTQITNIVDPAPGHNWDTTYESNETHHWHNCTNANCPITEDDQKDGYAVHTPGAAATETTPQTCTDCGYVLAPALGHIHTHSLSKDYSKDETGHWHTCSGCDEKVDFEAHTEDSGTVTVQPTAYTTGVRVYSCSICGYVLRTETIPATGMPSHPTYPTYPTYTTYPVVSTPSVFTEKLTVKAELDGGTATLSWDKVENADKYYVYQYKDGKYVEIKTTADTSVTFKGLKNGKTYKFLVRYSIGGKLSPMTYSDKITVKVYYKPIAKATSTENSIKLTWRAVPNAEKYAVYKYVDGKAVKLCETEKLAVRINKLTPDTKYQYIVRAYVDGKWTSMKKSDIVTFKTKAE